MNQIFDLQFPSWPIWIMLAAVLLAGVKFAKRKEWQEEPWSLDVSKGILGMLVALKEEAVLGFARKFYMVLLPVCLVAFVALYKATVYMLTTYSYWSEFFNPPGYLDKFRCLSCQLPMVIVFMFIVLLLMLKIRFSNGVLKFLGEISLELYLIHNLFLMGFRTPGKIMIQGTFSYVIAVLVCSLVLAFLLHQMDQLIIRLLSGKKENQ